MLRTLRLPAAALAFCVSAAILPGQALAQKQAYEPWVYEQMVPTGPELQNLEQAQPIPEQRPSHWQGVKRLGTGENGRAYSNRLNLGSNNRVPAGNPSGENNRPAGRMYGFE
ncbi:hypothetical protein [Azospirillum sp. SYSU D00513]|uniref:hypothetical protein n=1 Tax=Azospirillum sp. SYSU D00513 TaxID=2812561 RepID=UPI001A95D743|nr:hypothetical protein [Azospirillum sp. SYSU D00513]